MTPALATQDIANDRLRQAYSDTDFSLAQTHASQPENDGNICRLNLGELPPFYRTVVHVFQLVSKKEMRWIHTSAVVTFVKDHLFRRYFSMFKNPRNPVRQVSPSRAIPPAAGPENSISNFLNVSSPIPAIGCFIHVLKKSIAKAHCGLRGHEGILP